MIALVAATSLAATACGAPLWWDGGTTNIDTDGNGQSDGGNGNWTLSTKNFDQNSGQAHTSWSNANAATAVFGGTPGTVTITTSSGISAAGVNFLTSGYTLGTNSTSNKLTLTGVGIDAGAAINVTGTSVASAISAPVVMNGALNSTQTWWVGPTNSLNLSGAISSPNLSTLSIAGGGTVSTSGITNTGSLLLSGGTTLNVASAYFNAAGAGDTVIGDNSDGTLNATATFSTNASALLVVGNGNGVRGTLNVKGATTTATYGLIRVGIGTVNAPSNSIGTITISGGVFETGAAGDNSAVTKGIYLGNNGSGSGTLNLDGGTLRTNLVIQRDDTNATITAGLTKGSVINFNGGTLQATGTSTSVATNVTANVRGGGAVIDTNGNTITIPANLTHSSINGDAAIDGGLTKSGSGTLVLTGANTYTGPTNVNAGILQIGTGGTVGSIAGNTISLASGTQLSINRSDTLDLASTISGSGSIRIDGVGGLKLSNSNNYSGGTTVGATSTLIAGANNAFGTGTITVSNPTTLQAAGGPRTLASGLTLSGASVVVSGDQSLTINGAVAGGSGLNRSLTNSLASGPNSPTLTLGGTTNIASGSSNRTLTITTSAGRTTFINGPVVNGGTSSASNFAVDGGGTTIFTGTGSYGGTTTISAGGTVFQIGNGGTSGSIGNSPITVDSGKLVHSRSDIVTLNNTISGSGSFEQAGSGKLIVGGLQSYSGGTTLSSGTLVARSSSSLGTGAVAVNSGAVLAGEGTIPNLQSNPVTINSGGIITAGTGATAADQVGTLTTTNQQSWTSGGIFALKIASTATTPTTDHSGVYWDKLVMGSLTMSAATSANPFTIRIINASGGALTFVPGATFKFAHINGSSSFVANRFSLDTTALALSNSLFSVSETNLGGGGSDLYLNFTGGSSATSSPEPTTTLLGGLAGGVILTSRRRRRTPMRLNPFQSDFKTA